jgi:hypothetical protein
VVFGKLEGFHMAIEKYGVITSVIGMPESQVPGIPFPFAFHGGIDDAGRRGALRIRDIACEYNITGAITVSRRVVLGDKDVGRWVFKKHKLHCAPLVFIRIEIAIIIYCPDGRIIAIAYTVTVTETYSVGGILVGRAEVIGAGRGKKPVVPKIQSQAFVI